MKLRYYFDFISPYSYLSWQWVREEICKGKHQFELYPVVLGQLIDHHKTKGPAQIPEKRSYLFKDCLRFSALNGVPFKPPKYLPFNSVYALRVALNEISADKQIIVIDSVFSAGWGRGLDIGDPDVLIKILNDVDLNGTELLGQTGSREARLGLKVNVKDAIERGLFGVPSFLCNDELFWGNDSIPNLEKYLNRDDYYDKVIFERFNEMFKEI